MLKKIILTCLICLNLNAKSGFGYYGDVMQILPFAMMAYSYYIDDKEGIKQQALGSGITLLSTSALKQSFVLLARDGKKAPIAKRPISDSYNGFPSGHTSFAFSAVGFAAKRYGIKTAAIPAVIATSVGISRIYDQRHTTLQVITGAILGFGVSYFLASKENLPNLSNLAFFTSTSISGNLNYHIAYKMSF